jgi:CheY-like chemotaxis protein
MLQRSIDRRIDVRWERPATAPWTARADASQLMQALLNLGLNARDAMPSGGTLTFTARNVSFAGAALPAPRQPGEFIQLTVADTGHGLSPEALSRLFEPYFSTKDPSRGPGLGLTITAAVVAEHGGWMEVESREGQGAQFHVFLPRARDAAREPVRAAAPDPQLLGGRERILVVDDEELVRMVVKAILSYRGYDVIEAADGQAAVEAYRTAQPPVDLVLMDVHMPRLNGYDALRQIRALNPKARAVILSGGVHDGASDPLSGQSGVAFLHKPFENQELLQTVRKKLEEG